jgi:hypothetical protein
MVFLGLLSVILFANQNFLDDFLSYVLRCLVLFNDFTTKHIVEGRN